MKPRVQKLGEYSSKKSYSLRSWSKHNKDFRNEIHNNIYMDDLF